MDTGVFENLDDTKSSLNKMMTYEEFLEWTKFDDSNSNDEERLETLEIFSYEGVPI